LEDGKTSSLSGKGFMERLGRSRKEGSMLKGSVSERLRHAWAFNAVVHPASISLLCCLPGHLLTW
jgi:hypothetical protein